MPSRGGMRDPPPAPRGLRGPVITSYSIQYTKLYERRVVPNQLGAVYVELVRGTPLLVQIFLAYYVFLPVANQLLAVLDHGDHAARNNFV